MFSIAPLKGKCVVLTRPDKDSATFQKKLARIGAHVFLFPTIQIHKANLSEHEIAMLQDIENFDWVIFTSANGVRACMQTLHDLGMSSGVFARTRIGAIGPATARALQTFKLVPTFQPSTYTTQSIAREIGDIAGARMLLPRADIAPKDLQEALQAKGAFVENIAMYITELIRTPDPAFEALVRGNTIDYITFTSASTVRGFVQRTQRVDIREASSRIPVVCIGPVTAQAARAAAFKSIHIAKAYTTDGIYNTLLTLP